MPRGAAAGSNDQEKKKQARESKEPPRMEHIELKRRSGFHVLAGSSESQAATMTLAPGTSTGGPDNRHESSDQWLYVVSGEGHAVVEEQRVELGPGDLLLIESGESHEIVNGGDDPLVTLNVYAPPAY
jgi:mannose-6-phosphate isomerase-like protein (cupin superfamily)